LTGACSSDAIRRRRGSDAIADDIPSELCEFVEQVVVDVVNVFITVAWDVLHARRHHLFEVDNWLC
jgi:hypothetical protein